MWKGFPGTHVLRPSGRAREVASRSENGVREEGKEAGWELKFGAGVGMKLPPAVWGLRV